MNIDDKVFAFVIAIAWGFIGLCATGVIAP